ncbi:Site-specific integrase [Methylorubrum populi]
MQGHITERSPGRWAIVLDQKDEETGQRKRKWHSFKGTKREAQKECARLITEMENGEYVKPSKTTLAEFLERWLAHIQPNVGPRTYERYTELVRKTIVPLLGTVVVTRLLPEHISSAYVKALSSGRRDGSGGLSPQTVHHTHRVLHQALSLAVRWRILARNPAAFVNPPRVERAKINAYDSQETAALLEHFRLTRMYVPVLLAVMCGLRRGEITALRWRSVDLAAQQIAVERSTEQTKRGTRDKDVKNNRGRRVAIPSFVANELLRHRVKQSNELGKIGIQLNDSHFIYSQVCGEPIQPNSLTHEFRRILSLSTELPRIRFHDLRHSHATQMLLQGVHPKVAQERLGHSSIAITLDLYSHVLPGMQEDAAAKVDAALRAAIERVSS